MSYQIMQCGKCHMKMQAPPGAAAVNCPGCGTKLAVPGARAAAPAPAPPRAAAPPPRAAAPPVRAAPPTYATGAGGGVGAGGGYYGRGPAAAAAAGYYGASARVAAPPPRPPAPRPAAPPDPSRLFAMVDTDRSGRIEAAELQKALSTGWHQFSMRTAAMMIGMFDYEGKRSLSLPEFQQLWTFLTAWKKSFDSADADRSGNINYRELCGVLTAMGYRLSPTTLGNMWRVYDEDGSGSIALDEYIQMMCELNRTTQVFQRYDTRRTGVVTLDYNQYLQIMLAVKVP